MLRILLGRARTGKSARVLEEIRALGDSSQQILLVPEQYTYEAERLLADSGWLPEPLRMPEVDPVLPIADTAADGEALPAFLGEDGDDGDEDEPGSAYAIAAE